MWEFTSGIPAFNNRSHDFNISLDICKGLRPEIVKKLKDCPECGKPRISFGWCKDCETNSMKEIFLIGHRKIKRLTHYTPFRPKAYQLDLNSDPHIHQQPIPEEYPSKDGFEQNRQLNVIAGGIFIHPDLVNKLIIMQEALLILFPPTPPAPIHPLKW
ncbi:hypothetical protein RhiirC2_856011 [Rhizophagus irregularis]|uniref:Uncharacterized protein n=1 Tax=Rhizophagus irregularis TaxID=588596 RepID=A0A2N1MJT1_9GLOM|nr:hypothetical protein RhiirC2_856011 [Rhizophagus irregularis]